MKASSLFESLSKHSFRMLSRVRERGSDFYTTATHLHLGGVGRWHYVSCPRTHLASGGRIRTHNLSIKSRTH